MNIGEFVITDVLLEAWTIRFPTVDLRREHPQMVLWLLKNPSRRPKNAIRFVETWLKKVRDQGARNMEVENKRGSATAERIGERYGVTARVGESQEEFNKRVIRAASGCVVRRIA